MGKKSTKRIVSTPLIARKRAFVLAGVLICLLALAPIANSTEEGDCALQKDARPCRLGTPVSLESDYEQAEQSFMRTCGKCHDAPDPAKPTCSSGLNAEVLLSIRDYMEMSKAGYSSALDCIEPEGKTAFESNCGRCHELPDPGKPSCISEPTREDLSRSHYYMEEVRRGKDLYGSHCGRCHELINPSDHGFEFWREHLCNGGESLDRKEGQQVLLYLKSQGKKGPDR